MLKKDLLKKMISEGGIKSCTILGVPTKELVEKYFDRSYDLLNLFNKYDIKYKLGPYNDSSVSVYFPSFHRKTYTDICSITINNPTIEQIDNVSHLFDSIEDYYQADIAPLFIDKIVGLDEDPLSFSDILTIIPESQSEIARRIGKARQILSDIKVGKTNITINVLRPLMNEYPLIPWNYFLRG